MMNVVVSRELAGRLLLRSQGHSVSFPGLNSSACNAVAEPVVVKEPVMNTGKVKWFNARKGYGFIEPADGSMDVFVHISALTRSGLHDLQEGQAVSYDLLQDRRSGKTAVAHLELSTGPRSLVS